MSFFDLQAPFFRPLWIRIAVTAVCLLWGGFEFATGSVFWGMLFGALGVWCAWEFFFAFAPRKPDGHAKTTDPEGGTPGPDDRNA